MTDSNQGDVFEAPNQTTNTEDVITTLVGEGKKFKSVEDLAKGKLQADSHIAKIEAENRDLRKAVEDLKTQSNQQVALTELVEALKNKQSTDGNPQALDLEQLTGIVRNVNKEERENQIRTANRNRVNEEILKIAGGDVGKAREIVTQRASELGLDLDTIRSLSERSPSAILAILNVTSNQSKNDPPPATKAGVNTQALFNGNTTDAKPNSYYSELRRKMGVAKFYADTKLQAKMFADAEKLGDKFFQ